MSKVIDKADGWLTDALRELDGSALLTSPFLTYDACHRIAVAAEQSSYKFVLVTTLDAGAVAGGYQSVQGLARLLAAGVEVRHVDRLHAKCFLLGSRGMVGSANLTGPGLGSSVTANRELGVELDTLQLAHAVRTINGWPSLLVETTHLDDLLAKSKALTRLTRDDTDARNADAALTQAERLLADARDSARGLWLKLEYGDPALDGWRQESFFASPNKGKPGFRPGDLVVVCAKGTKDCYAVVEVTAEPEFQPADYLQWTAQNDPGAEARWPWVNRTKPRMVPSELMELKLHELGVSGPALQNGHVRLKFDQFTAAVRALARLATG